MFCSGGYVLLAFVSQEQFCSISSRGGGMCNTECHSSCTCISFIMCGLSSVQFQFQCVCVLSVSYDEEIGSWEQDRRGGWNYHRWCQDLWNTKIEGLCRFSCFVILVLTWQSSVLWHCWLGDRKCIRPVTKLDVGLLVVMIWCMTYSSSSPVVTTTSIILCFNKHQLTQVHLENGR